MPSLTTHSLYGHYPPYSSAFLSSPSLYASLITLASNPSPRHVSHIHFLLWCRGLIFVFYLVASIYVCSSSHYVCRPVVSVSSLTLTLCSSTSFVMPQTFLNLPSDVLFCIFTRDEIELTDILRLSLVSRTTGPPALSLASQPAT